MYLISKKYLLPVHVCMYDVYIIKFNSHDLHKMYVEIENLETNSDNNSISLTIFSLHNHDNVHVNILRKKPLVILHL